MKRAMIFLCGVLLAGCSALQKHETQNREALAVTRQMAASSTIGRSASRNLTIQDSAAADYVLYIKPKGIFSYSTAEGFRGEADQLLVKGRMQHNVQLNVQEETAMTLKDTVTQQNTLKQKQVETSVHRQRFQIGAWWWGLLLAVVGGVVVWWYVRRKS